MVSFFMNESKGLMVLVLDGSSEYGAQMLNKKQALQLFRGICLHQQQGQLQKKKAVHLHTRGKGSELAHSISTIHDHSWSTVSNLQGSNQIFSLEASVFLK